VPELQAVEVEVVEVQPVDVEIVEPVKLPSIMLVGDSITHGPAGAHTWRYFLYERLAATFGPGDYFVGPNNAPNDGGPDDYAVPNGWDKDHAALSGRMLDCYLDGVIWDEPCTDSNRAADDFAAHNPDLAVVLLGANDVLLPWGQSAPSDFLGHAEQLVAAARANNPEVSFLLMGVIPVDPALVPDAAAERDELNAGLEALAARLDTPDSPVAYASAGAAFDPVLHTYDGVHPNSAGDEIIAANVAAGLADDYGIGRDLTLQL
ncbi:MAG: SGNH/GDSL hydrolase family protein, partial [Acidimicrobiia bacterium]